MNGMGRDDAKKGTVHCPVFVSASRHAACFVRRVTKTCHRSAPLNRHRSQGKVIGQAATLV